MSSTCPYILSKTSQLVVAARISSNNDNVKDLLNSNKLLQHLVKLKTNLQLFQVDASQNLPPRFNVKSFTTAAKYLGLRSKINKLFRFRRTQNQNANSSDAIVVVDNFHGNESLRAIDKRSETYFAEFGITEDELGR